MQQAPFMQARFVLLGLLWAVMVVSHQHAWAQDFGLDYRIPAGFVYEEASLTPEKARELAKRGNPGREPIVSSGRPSCDQGGTNRRVERTAPRNRLPSQVSRQVSRWA